MSDLTEALEELDKLKARIKEQYSFESTENIEILAYAELSLIELLDQFFKAATGQGTRALFSKDKLNVLDVYCGVMPYARPLQSFFGRYGKSNRQAKILGIDTDTSGVIGDLLRKHSKNEGKTSGIDVKHTTIQNLEEKDFDLVTCFHPHPNDDPVKFLTRIYALLANDGLFLVSFNTENEIKAYKSALLVTGFEVIYRMGTVKNNFDERLRRLLPNNKCFCLARKKS